MSVPRGSAQLKLLASIPAPLRQIHGALRRPPPNDSSLCKIELLRTGVPGAAKRPVIAERRRDVAELDVGDDHALHHGREADRADLINVVGPVAIELLRELDLLLGADGTRLVDDLDDTLHLRRRLGAFLAAG